MRAGIQRLVAIATTDFGMDLTDGALYCFASSDCLKMKLLRFDTNGFCMYYAKLAEGTFRWEHSADGEVSLEVERRQLIWLLDGIDSNQPTAPRPVVARGVFWPKSGCLPVRLWDNMTMVRRRTTPTQPTPEQEIALLLAQLVSLARDNARLAAEATAVAASMSDRVGDLEARMARLVEMIKLAHLRVFVPRSERIFDEQMCLSLLDDAEAWADPVEPEPEPTRGNASPKPHRRGGKRRIDTSTMERVVAGHDLGDRACPQCGSGMSEMKVEVTVVVRLVPTHLVVEEHRRRVYRCRSCCDANAAGEEVASRIVRAPMPRLMPIPGSFATASMISWAINAK